MSVTCVSLYVYKENNFTPLPPGILWPAFPDAVFRHAVSSAAHSSVGRTGHSESVVGTEVARLQSVLHPRLQGMNQEPE